MLMPRDGAVTLDIPDDVRVVVAEDDRGTRLVLRGLLRSLGIREIVECANGAEAYVQIQRTAPDLLISDWEMPEVSGIALTRLVRNHPDSPNPLMPVIMLTSHSNQSLVARARDAGVTAFLAKPVSRKALAARLEAAVQPPGWKRPSSGPAAMCLRAGSSVRTGDARSRSKASRPPVSHKAIWKNRPKRETCCRPTTWMSQATPS
jgi:CheY-like chemotaxis protein